MSISEKINKQIHSCADGFDLRPSFKGKTLSIEIASTCNEKCIYCKYSAEGLHKKGKMIDEQFFYRITREAHDLGITDVGVYIIGEPLINPKVYDYVEYLKHEVGFEYVYISTNGILLTPENLEKLVAAGIDSIKFSVSGSNRITFQKHHGVDAFDRVYNNIKYAYNYRSIHNLDYKLYMFSIITKYNEAEKSEFENVFGPYVDELILNNVLADKEVIGVEEFLTIDDKSGYVTQGIDRTLPCQQLFNRININEDGYLLACCDDIKGMTIIDDLNYKSLKEGVYGEAMIELRRKHLENRIENTVCNFCIRGVEEEIRPLSNHVEHLVIPRLESIDITDEIKKRFDI